MSRRSFSLRAVTTFFALVALTLTTAACASDTSDSEQDESQPADTAPEESAATAGSEEQDASPTTADRPDGLPDEMPVPDYASYAFSIEPHMFFQTDVPVAELIEDMERLLAETGWEIVDRIEKVAWSDDVLFRVTGHGFDMDVYLEPTAGSETESQIVFGPGGGLVG
ncbi:MAG: hypothetical protein WD377_04255 [Nitriliruptoraceae bacterium]